MDTLRYKSLLLFSLPSIFASLLAPLSGVVDTALVGRLNTSWLAALTVGTVIFNSISWIFNFLIHTSTQGLSDALARENSNKVSECVSAPIFCALGLGIVSVILLYLIRIDLYILTGSTTSILSLVDSYFVVRLMGFPAFLLYTTTLSLLRGLEKVMLCLYLVLLTTVLNIVLSYLFLYHFHWGMEGAAWGSVIADYAGMALSFLFLFFHLPNNTFRFFWRLPKRGFLKFGKNSFNLFGRSFILTMVFFISTKLSGNLGVKTLAAHQIVLQCWLFSSYFIDGLAITANILGAKYNAKKQMNNFKKLSLRLMVLGGGIGLVFTLIFSLGSQMIWQLFTGDLQVIAVISLVWPLISCSQLFNAVAFVMDGLLFGTGDFAFLRCHMILGFLLVFLPIAFYSVRHQSFTAVWWGLVLLNIYRMASGTMKLKKMELS